MAASLSRSPATETGSTCRVSGRDVGRSEWPGRPETGLENRAEAKQYSWTTAPQHCHRTVWTLSAPVALDTPCHYHPPTRTLLWITCVSSKPRVTGPPSAAGAGKTNVEPVVKGSQSGVPWNHPGPQTRRRLPVGHWQTSWVTTGPTHNTFCSGERKEL